MIENPPAMCVSPLTKVEAIEKLCKNLPVPGSAIEVGVWRGGMAVNLLEFMPERKLYLADTYTGIPYCSPQDNLHMVGMFGDTSVESVTVLFAPFPNVVILPGIFPDAFRELLDKESFAVVHLDCDMYKSYLDGLEFLYPRTVSGGIIFLDDYRCLSASGCTIAVDEFMADKSEKIELLDGQYYFVKQ